MGCGNVHITRQKLTTFMRERGASEYISKRKTNIAFEEYDIRRHGSDRHTHSFWDRRHSLLWIFVLGEANVLVSPYEKNKRKGYSLGRFSSHVVTNRTLDRYQNTEPVPETVLVVLAIPNPTCA